MVEVEGGIGMKCDEWRVVRLNEVVNVLDM